jgi:hypothetical protein
LFVEGSNQRYLVQGNCAVIVPVCAPDIQSIPRGGIRGRFWPCNEIRAL